MYVAAICNTTRLPVTLEHINHVISLYACFNDNTLGKLWTSSMPYLFPFIVEYRSAHRERERERDTVVEIAHRHRLDENFMSTQKKMQITDTMIMRRPLSLWVSTFQV